MSPFCPPKPSKPHSVFIVDAQFVVSTYAGEKLYNHYLVGIDTPLLEKGDVLVQRGYEIRIIETIGRKGVYWDYLASSANEDLSCDGLLARWNRIAVFPFTPTKGLTPTPTKSITPSASLKEQVVHKVQAELLAEEDPNKITFLHYLLENYSIYIIEDILRQIRKHYPVYFDFSKLETIGEWERFINIPAFHNVFSPPRGNYNHDDIVSPINV